MKLLSKYAYFKQFLLSSKQGKLLLLFLAPFFVTPLDFNDIDRSKGVFVRVVGWFIPATSAFFCGALSSWIISILFKSIVPDIDGFSGSEYASRLEMLKSIAFIELTFLSFVGVCFYALVAPLRFRLLKFLFKKARNEFQAPTFKYYLLIGSSGVVWATLVIAFGGLLLAFGRSIENHAIAEQFVDHYSWLVLTLFVIWGLMSLRRSQIRSETQRQIFTTTRAKCFNIIFDFVVLGFLMLLCLWAVFAIGRV